MVGWVKGFDPLFEIYLSVIVYGRSQINISENPLPILQKTHFLTITFDKTVIRIYNIIVLSIMVLLIYNNIRKED